MSAAVAYAPYRYHRVQMNTVSLNNAHTKALVGASLKGYSLHCIIFRTATDSTFGAGAVLRSIDKEADPASESVHQQA